MAWLTACLGWALTIGSPELVAWATWDEVGIAAAIVMPSVLSTLSGVSPTLSSARLRIRWRWLRGKLSRSSVSTATLTFFRVGTSSVVTSSISSVSSNAWRAYSSKAGEVSTTTKSKWLLSRLSTRPISGGGMVSFASGCTGATSALTLSLYVVSSGSQHLEVEAALQVHHVGHRAGREQLEGDGDVAEGQVEVDQADPAGAAAGQGEREVHRQGRLADPALGGEHRDQGAAVTAGRGRRSTGQRGPDLVSAVDGGAEAGEVTLVDDLAHAGAQGLREHDGVHAPPDQDDADRRPGDPQHVGQRGRRLQVDRRPQHDGVLVRGVGQEPLELLEAGDDLRVRAADRGEQVGVRTAAFNDDRHGTSPEEILGSDARTGLDLGLVVQQAEAELAVATRRT